MNQQLCEVLNENGSLLGYCSAAKARILIKKSKAKIVDKQYKTIQLKG